MFRQFGENPKNLNWEAGAIHKCSLSVWYLELFHWRFIRASRPAYHDQFLPLRTAGSMSYAYRPPRYFLSQSAAFLAIQSLALASVWKSPT
jgi:hypothetical protein